MQLRGPALNGMNENGFSLSLFFFKNLSGSNLFGEEKYSGFLCSDGVNISVVTPGNIFLFSAKLIYKSMRHLLDGL